MRRGRHCAKPMHAVHHTPLPSLPLPVPIQSKQARTTWIWSVSQWQDIFSFTGSRVCTSTKRHGVYSMRGMCQPTGCSTDYASFALWQWITSGFSFLMILTVCKRAFKSFTGLSERNNDIGYSFTSIPFLITCHLIIYNRVSDINIQASYHLTYM